MTIWEETVGLGGCLSSIFHRAAGHEYCQRKRPASGTPPIHIWRTIRGTRSTNLSPSMLPAPNFCFYPVSRQTGGTPVLPAFFFQLTHSNGQNRSLQPTLGEDLCLQCHNGSGPDNMLIRKTSDEREMLCFPPGNVLIHPLLQHIPSFLHGLQAYRFSNSATSYWLAQSPTEETAKLREPTTGQS